ncbi:hypothetical protein BS78_08G073300 [Paspalum vaginatum]|nr:hypothetical protein BS78_08G073300 [Paspalum vaginatum]
MWMGKGGGAAAAGAAMVIVTAAVLVATTPTAAPMTTTTDKGGESSTGLQQVTSSNKLGIPRFLRQLERELGDTCVDSCWPCCSVCGWFSSYNCCDPDYLCLVNLVYPGNVETCLPRDFSRWGECYPS